MRASPNVNGAASGDAAPGRQLPIEREIDAGGGEMAREGVRRLQRGDAAVLLTHRGAPSTAAR